MSVHIPEPDWRIFKEIRAKLLERYCARVLQEVVATGHGEDTAHERYLKIYTIMRERDKQLANAFNSFSRSEAAFSLGLMRRMKLLTDEELNLFTEQTRIYIENAAAV